MNYHTLGRTGIKVSEIGMGCEGFVLTDDERDYATAFVLSHFPASGGRDTVCTAVTAPPA